MVKFQCKCHAVKKWANKRLIIIFFIIISFLLVEPECQGNPQECKQNPADTEGHECYHPR